MVTEIRMPQMGESIAEGTLTRWFKKPGDAVKRDEPLFEISTDKVDAEVPAPADGVLQKILVNEGTTVAVNSVVALFGEPGAVAAPVEKLVAAKPAAAATKPIAARAESVAPPPKVATAAVAVAPPPASRVAEHHEDDSSSSNGSDRRVRSSPLVRRIARENGIADLAGIPGTGLEGRITKDDILGFIEKRGVEPSAGVAARSTAPSTARPAPAAAHASALPLLNLPRTNVDVSSLSIMRRKIAEHMVHSRRTSAHVHSVFEVDMTRVMKLRAKHKDAFEVRHGAKLTMMPFFCKAVIGAIRDFPWVNASLDGDEILVHKSVNMGIAVALEGGLIVPVIRGADELNLIGLQKRVTDLANRARSKQLVPDEVTGGTFTITNPGQFGGLFGIPIISQPQVAILGVGGIQKRPIVVEGDAIAVREMCYLCLGYDHRLVDGAYADQFMAKVKSLLETFDETLLS
ncbi:MAG: dihydrolipoamide acetyltransferase family protein [Planctomycetota bacterium]